jgi:3-oxoacyl-[acyl-carrier-protein] synthase III
MRPIGSTISGLAAYRPARMMPNTEIALRTGTTPEWIEQRTGIRTRGHAAADEDLVTMSVAAVVKAMAAACVEPSEVDLLVVATATRKQQIPGIAPEVATLAGIPAAGAYDVNAVCAGFTYALSQASNAVRLGEASHAVVVGVERTSDGLDPDDKDTYVLFGDGAGAAVVSRSSEPCIGPVAWGSDGGRANVLRTQKVPDGRDLIRMDGPLVYKWSTAVMPDVARRACRYAGVSIDDVAWFVPHQANLRIIDTLSRLLGFPADRVAHDVVDTGNTSSASIPLALTRLRESGRARHGDLVLLLGFGAGLTYAGQVVHMP